MREALQQYGLKWDKVRDYVQERFVQSHPFVHSAQMSAENMEVAAMAEELFTQITGEECEKRWGILRKFMTNAQIARAFPPWSDHEVYLALPSFFTTFHSFPYFA